MASIIFLHGALGSAAQFNAVLAQKPTEIQAIALNFPGHGTTPAPTPFSVEYFGESVLRYMDDNGMANARLFGYSMGGYIALWLAWKYPERILSVKTYGTKLEWNPEVAAGMSRMFDPEKIEAKAPALAASLAGAHGTGEWKNLCVRTAGFLHDLGQGLGLPAEAYSQIKCPVNIARGTLDQVVSENESMQVASKIPSGSFFALPEGKHLLEQTDVQVIANYAFNNII